MSVVDELFFNDLLSEPDSAEVIVDVDDSKETASGEDPTDAVVTEDDNSEEVKSDLDDNANDDSQEGIVNWTIVQIVAFKQTSYKWTVERKHQMRTPARYETSERIIKR